jgi:hypothetical protein
MHRDGGATTVGVTELLVGTALPHLLKSEACEDLDNFARRQDRETAHVLSQDRLRADELRLKLWFTVLQKHGDHLAEVGVKLIQSLALRMGAREAGNVAHK